MQLREIMTRNVEDIPPAATLQHAAEKMRLLDVGALPVCDNNELIGMITDRDIAVRAVADGADPTRAQVRDAMTGQLLYCYEDDDVEKAVRLMEENQIRRLPVFDRAQRLCGILSLGDLAIRIRNDKLCGEVLEQVSEPNIQHA